MAAGQGFKITKWPAALYFSRIVRNLRDPSNPNYQMSINNRHCKQCIRAVVMLSINVNYRFYILRNEEHVLNMDNFMLSMDFYQIFYWEALFQMAPSMFTITKTATAQIVLGWQNRSRNLKRQLQTATRWIIVMKYHPTSGLMQILHFDWLRYWGTISNSHRVTKFLRFIPK